MLKKFVSSLLALLILCGCTSSEGSVNNGTQAQQAAEKLVRRLGMTDTMEEVRYRVVKGLFFQGEDVITDGSVYYSKINGNKDTVGVFYTDDTETCMKYLQEYLKDQKTATESQYPEEVFKISNAVVDENGKVVVLVVTSDIEEAKKQVKQFLGK